MFCWDIVETGTTEWELRVAYMYGLKLETTASMHTLRTNRNEY